MKKTNLLFFYMLYLVMLFLPKISFAQDSIGISNHKYLLAAQLLLDEINQKKLFTNKRI
jgi:hypothetical protein